MLTITPNGTNRLDLELNGKLDSDDMKIALDQLVRHAEDIAHGRMLYRITDLEWPTLGAIGVELSRLPELFRLIKRFDRAAVLSDKKWLQKVSELEGSLIPGLEIKAFDLDQQEEAEAWLAVTAIQ